MAATVSKWGPVQLVLCCGTFYVILLQAPLGFCLDLVTFFLREASLSEQKL